MEAAGEFRGTGMRIRVTHPGVNAAGIVDKMEANDTIKYAAGSHIRKGGQ